MYQQHQRKIEEYAFSSDEGFSRTTLFVLLTIQQPLDRVKHMMRDVDVNGFDSAYLNNELKNTGYRYVCRHKHTLRTTFMSMLRQRNAEVAVAQALNIPGLGLVKAGFLCQLLGFNVGCFDVHNIKRFDMKLSDFKLNKKATTATKVKKIKQYVNLCNSLGGAQNLWDGWCDHIAHKAVKEGRYNKDLVTDELVSLEHLVALGLDNV